MSSASGSASCPPRNGTTLREASISPQAPRSWSQPTRATDSYRAISRTRPMAASPPRNPGATPIPALIRCFAMAWYDASVESCWYRAERALATSERADSKADMTGRGDVCVVTSCSTRNRDGIMTHQPNEPDSARVSPLRPAEPDANFAHDFSPLGPPGGARRPRAALRRPARTHGAGEPSRCAHAVRQSRGDGTAHGLFRHAGDRLLCDDHVDLPPWTRGRRRRHPRYAERRHRPPHRSSGLHLYPADSRGRADTAPHD